MTFKAYRSFDEGGTVQSRFVDMTIDELDRGEVVIAAEHSSINYKDALSHDGSGKIMRKFPTNAGIDVAGTVASSTDPRFGAGDAVLVTGYDLGVGHDGGYAERVRVPADWVVMRPAGMTSFDAMTLGTAGFTAALAVELMLHDGLRPAGGPVAVTGATGGVGSVAVELLAKLGHDVVAITGKAEEAAYLLALGAKEVLPRSTIDLTKIRALDKATYAGAVDNLGGPMLAWLLSMQKVGGTVAAVGLAAGHKLETTVMPFILRGVHLLGTDSVNCPMPTRQRVWEKLAHEWKPARMQAAVSTIDLAELPGHFAAYLKGQVRGRTVVRIA